MPNAISKLVSAKVAIGDNRGAYRIFKVAFAIFGLLGFMFPIKGLLTILGISISTFFNASKDNASSSFLYFLFSSKMEIYSLNEDYITELVVVDTKKVPTGKTTTKNIICFH